MRDNKSNMKGKSNNDESGNNKSNHRPCCGRIFAGILILILGVGLLLKNIFAWFSFNYVWPLLIIALGIYLIMGRHHERRV